jgi:hypothetical protein
MSTRPPLRKRIFGQTGATRLRPIDILTALVLLGILAIASYMQFPAYRGKSVAPAPPAASK